MIITEKVSIIDRFIISVEEHFNMVVDKKFHISGQSMMCNIISDPDVSIQDRYIGIYFNNNDFCVNIYNNYKYE